MPGARSHPVRGHPMTQTEAVKATIAATEIIRRTECPVTLSAARAILSIAARAMTTDTRSVATDTARMYSAHAYLGV